MFSSLSICLFTATRRHCSQFTLNNVFLQQVLAPSNRRDKSKYNWCLFPLCITNVSKSDCHQNVFIFLNLIFTCSLIFKFDIFVFLCPQMWWSSCDYTSNGKAIIVNKLQHPFHLCRYNLLPLFSFLHLSLPVSPCQTFFFYCWIK